MSRAWQTAIFIGVFTLWCWYNRPAFKPDKIDRARFALVYGAAREATDFYTRCSIGSSPPSADQRAQVVNLFRDLRGEVKSSSFQDDLEIVDLQQQVRSEDKNGTVRDQAICERLGASAPKSQADVFLAITAVETFLKGDRS